MNAVKPADLPGRGTWGQLHLTYPDWHAAESAAVTNLLPLLDEPEHRPRVPGWWYVRKGPTWRVRLHTPFEPDDDAARHLLARIAAELDRRGPLQRWSSPIYEPETHAFGGAEAMAAAHSLFVADSRHVVDLLARTVTHHGPNPDLRRELALVLGTRLLRGAGLEWSEQGDVWRRVATRRAADPDPAAPAPELVRKVHRFLTADSATALSPLHHTPHWPAAFTTAGQRLAALAATGRLTRGLRAVLAHHLLFLFNRLGIPAAHQHRLATAAVHAVFGEDPMTPHPATTDREVDREADRLRQDLADHIRARGTFHTPAVEKAFRVVPRHAFLPGVALPEAYARRPVVTRRDTDGSALSSASSPNLVAGMLELLDVVPGHRILEIGAATGINAALLAELTGPTGHVTTIEIDDDLAHGARDALAATGYAGVEVITGDGALGHPAGGPFDRIVVTAGAFDIPADWWDQLAPRGRIVVPLRLHPSGLTRVLPLVRRNTDNMVSTSALVCGFVPMRGSGEYAENMIRLTEDAILNIDVDDQPDAHALTRTMSTTPPVRRWTGIEVRDDQPVEHLDLWLATNGERTSAFGRLSVGAPARDAGIDPARRWAGAALHAGGSLAYLTARPTGTDGTDELGVTAHGPAATALADELAHLLNCWNDHRPGQPVITAAPTAAPPASGDRTTITRPHTTFTVTW